MVKNEQFKKNFIWNLIGTTFNAFNSLFFMVIITRINGLEDAGILYMIGIYAGRIYQVTENDKSITDKDYIVNRIISCLAIIIISIVFVIIRKYDIYKSSIFIILATYKALEAFSDVFYGIMQKQELLEKAGKSTFMKAFISVIIFTIIDCLTHNLVLASFSIVITFLSIIIFYDIKITRKIMNKDTKVVANNVITIFKSGFFTFAIAFLGLYITNAPKYAIDNFLTEDIQAIFGIIVMPATVMGLLAQFIIHPYLNEIFELYKTNQYGKLKKLLYRIILVIFGCGVICSLAGYLLGTQVLGFIYGLNLTLYKNALLAILVAATFYTMAGIISPILVTMRYTKIQFIIYMAISIMEFLLCNILVSRLEINGAIIAYFATMIIYFITFFIVSMFIINKKQAISSKENQ